MPPSRDLADLGLREQHDVERDLPERPGGDASAAPSVGRSRVRRCQGRTGSASSSSCASVRATREPVVAERGERARPRRRAGRRAPRRDRVERRPAASRTATSQPAAFSPNVVGSACCSSVRPAIGVDRCSLGQRGAARPRARRARRASSVERAAGDEHRRGVHHVLARGAPVHVAARRRRRRRRAAPRRAARPGLPTRAARARAPARSKRSASQARRSPRRPPPGSRRPARRPAASAASNVEHRLQPGAVRAPALDAARSGHEERAEQAAQMAKKTVSGRPGGGCRSGAAIVGLRDQRARGARRRREQHGSAALASGSSGK